MNPPALPWIPLRIPARLGRDLLLRLWWSFSMDRYLFLMWAGTTRLSKSLFWILGSSVSPSLWSIACFMCSWWNPWVNEITVTQMNSWMSRAMFDAVMPVSLSWLSDWPSESLRVYIQSPPHPLHCLALHTSDKGETTLQSYVPFRPPIAAHELIFQMDPKYVH